MASKNGPNKEEVIKAANAQAKPHHPLPDEGVLPEVSGPTLDRAGIKDRGYLDKKGLVDGVDVFYNCLPPGMNIEDQHLADIREQTMKTVTDLGYPGDGWD